MQKRDLALTGALTGALIALGGCSMAPDYHVPTVAAPPAFKETGAAVPAGWAPAQPLDEGRGAWWRTFADPVLDDLEQRVEKASPNVAAALARYDQALALARVARADILPQASVGASIERTRTSAARPQGPGTSSTFNQYVASGTIAWEADLWGRIRNQIKAARAEAQASDADLSNVRLSLQAQLADAYFRLRGLDAQRALLLRTAAAFTRAQDLTETRHEGGIANGLDVNRARTVLADARAQLSLVANQRAAIEHQIAALIGESPSSFAIAPVDGLAPPPLVPASLPSELLQHRPDIASAERRAFAANARIGAARAAFFPTVTLGASGGFDAATGPLFSNAASFWMLGPAQALLAVFDGGRRAANVRFTRAQYDEAAATYRDTVLTAFREVEDALAAARLLAQASIDQRNAATAAQKTEDLALIRYRDGASDYLDVVTAQTAALTAERNALALETNRMQAAVALLRALGGGVPARPIPSSS